MRSKTSKRTAKKSKPPAARAAIDPKRLAQVCSWIVQGQTEGDIVEAISKEWPAEDCKSLIVAAIQQIENAADPPAKLLKGWILEAYRELHRRLTGMGDYTGAIRAVAKIQAIVESSPKGDGPPPGPGQPTSSGETDAEAEARAHLAPLFDDGASLPLPELARLAAQRILNR